MNPDKLCPRQASYPLWYLWITPEHDILYCLVIRCPAKHKDTEKKKKKNVESIEGPFMDAYTFSPDPIIAGDMYHLK